MWYMQILVEKVEAAQGLFKPYYENKNIVGDLARTKQYKKEQQRMNTYRTNPQEFERKKYWQTGEKYMNYLYQDFIEADPIGYKESKKFLEDKSTLDNKIEEKIIQLLGTTISYDEDKQELSKLGIRIGAKYFFMPNLMKKKSLELNAIL